MVMFSNTDCHEEEEDMLVQTSTNEQNAFLLLVQQFLQMEEEDQEDQYQMFISGFDEMEVSVITIFGFGTCLLDTLGV